MLGAGAEEGGGGEFLSGEPFCWPLRRHSSRKGAPVSFLLQSIFLPEQVKREEGI